ncbi:hypothetical protein [Alkalibaculum bacchi]|nr:hypothetical protein [Alkalibaculum bacchi]
MRQIYFKYALISASVGFSILIILIILNGMFERSLPDGIPITIAILSQVVTTYYLFNKENQE